MLTETALAVYQHAVANPNRDAQSAAFELGLTPDELSIAQRELTEIGLLQSAPGLDDRLVALSPEIALSSVVSEDERAVRELQARIEKQRTDYLSLVPHFTDARDRAVRSPGMEVVEDLAIIRDYLADMCRDVRTELLIAHPTWHISAASLNEGLPQDLEMLSRGVRRRSLYLTSNRDSLAVQRAVAAVTEAGAEVRVLPVIPLRVMCFDANVAMLSRSESAGDKAAIVVRDTALVRSICQIFVAAWEYAEPFCTATDAGGDLSESELAILAGLAAGLSDDQIARRQDIGVRTCRRHIHDLMERLDAQSRFQAGVLATKRSWI